MDNEAIIYELVDLNTRMQGILDIVSSWGLAIASIQYWTIIILPALGMFALMWWILKQFLWTR